VGKMVTKCFTTQCSYTNWIRLLAIYLFVTTKTGLL